MSIIISDSLGTPVYEIVASKWTPGYWCEPTCSTWFPINFKILDLRKDNAEISKLLKYNMGCCLEMCTNSDKYYLDFASVMSYEERVLLTVAVQEIDMLWFERKCPLCC